ncbi:DNA-processing protein DprA [Pseudomonas aeruginosa]|uniref:DNA-processing protein DprA n=1 Tax=Pseudomonas aeruginosa TaxID=287 RepID=UPI0015F51EF1|nr:DNA-processing protein DprA [Pseudomonas aeruginosa]MBA5360000.1 DNA-protecting protein DprA [Pseudomonas aeruginosa]
MDEREYWRNERVAFLALTTLKGVGFWTLHKIADQGIGFKDALKNPEKAGLEKHYPKSVECDDFQETLWAKGIEQARDLSAAGIRVYFRGEPDFPEKLSVISDPPQWVFVQGNASNLNKPAVAVVGTRKPSEDGLFLTRLVLAAISKFNCVSVSGLALGIDQACHSESIRYKVPTIAILGTGILNNYPKGSEQLREQILAKGGTVLSEYLPHQSYSSENFVRRNRLQAALCEVLIPAEWKIKSGTAHTVKYAHKYGKKIINIYLPLTKDDRPEIDFSLKEYGAQAFEAPFEMQGLIQNIAHELISPAENLTNSEIVENQITEQYVQQEPAESSPQDNENINDPQLPLI